MISSPLFIVAEKIRRSGFSKIIHVIADSHALSNSFATQRSVDAKTAEVVELVSRITQNLGLKEVYEIRIASQMAKEEGYAEELFKLAALDVHEYVKRELADIEFLRKKESVALKLSWQIDAKGTKFDERFFDEKYRELFNENLSFVYVRAGRTFDPKRPNVCPYTAIHKEARLLLKEDQDAEEILGALPESKTKMQTLQHLSEIVIDFEELFGSIEAETIAGKINLIIKRCLAPLPVICFVERAALQGWVDRAI